MWGEIGAESRKYNIDRDDWTKEQRDRQRWMIVFVMVKLKENDTRDRESEGGREVVMERYRYTSTCH